jgi:hypothetical protein
MEPLSNRAVAPCSYGRQQPPDPAHILTAAERRRERPLATATLRVAEEGAGAVVSAVCLDETFFERGEGMATG